jgi:hypothetical protein
MRRQFPRSGSIAPAGALTRVLLAIAALALAAPQPALSTPAGLVVIPHPISEPGLSYFKLAIGAGRSRETGAIELLNPTSRWLRVALARVDGETLGTLGSAYAQPGSPAHGSTLWLAPANRTLALPPRGSVTVPVSVSVPQGVAPGDYLSGISVEALDQRTRRVSRKGVSVASVARYAIGVEVSVPGPRNPLLQFTGAKLEREPSGLAFLLLARNSGNAILQGVHGFVRISRAGHLVVSRPIEAGTFVTGTSIAYPVTAFQETPAQGTRYRISAWLRYPGGIARLETTVAFGHRQAVIQQQYTHATPSHGDGTPWWLLAGAGAVIAYALFTTILLLRRRTRSEREPVAQ